MTSKIHLLSQLVRQLRPNERDDSASKLTSWAERVSRTSHMKVFDETVYGHYEGLIETFDVLGRSDLSQNLRIRLDQLTTHIKAKRDFPSLEVLAMLLELSRNPLESHESDSVLTKRGTVPLSLSSADPGHVTWAQYLEALTEEDPHEDHDYIEDEFEDKWDLELPSNIYENDELSEWSDLSSVEGEIGEVPKDQDHDNTNIREQEIEVTMKQSLDSNHPQDLKDWEKVKMITSLRRGAYWNRQDVTLSESDVLRECIMALLGYPDTILEQDILEDYSAAHRKFSLNGISVVHLPPQKLTAVLQQYYDQARFIRTFKNLKQESYVNRVYPHFKYTFIFGLMDDMLKVIEQKLLGLYNTLLVDLDEPVSLVQTLNRVINITRPYTQVVSVVQQTLSNKKTSVGGSGQVELLDNLFARIPICEVSGDEVSYLHLTGLFNRIFQDYLTKSGLYAWIYRGELPQKQSEPDFPLDINQYCDANHIWNELATPRAQSTPQFLQPLIEMIADTGKISYLLRKIGLLDDTKLTCGQFGFEQSTTGDDKQLLGTFNNRFHNQIASWLSDLHEEKNSIINRVIELALPQTLNNIKDVYFMMNGSAMTEFTSRIISAADPSVLTRVFVDLEFQEACQDRYQGFYIGSVDPRNFNIVVEYSQDSLVMSNIFTPEILVKCKRIFNLLLQGEILWRQAIQCKQQPDEHKRVVLINNLMAYIYQTVLQVNEPVVKTGTRENFGTVIQRYQNYVNKLHHLCFLDNTSVNHANEDLLSILQTRQDIVAFITSYESLETPIQIFKQLVVGEVGGTGVDE